MSQYKSPNILKIKIIGETLWIISKCLAHQNWIKLGRQLRIQDPELHQIQIREARNEHDLRESAYQMLKIWHERNKKCTLQDLFVSLLRLQWKAPVPEIEKHMKRYYWTNLPASNESSKWSNLNQRILCSIVLKMPIKFYANCHMICKSWHQTERQFYADWMITNRANWSNSSFQNAVDRKVNCKKIYWKSGKEWKEKSAPTLITEINTGDKIRHISFSNNGTMLAVCHFNGSLKIYDLKDFTVQFSRSFEERLYSSNFNRSNFCILAQTNNGTKVIPNAEGLPIIHSTSSYYWIRKPWLEDNIFLTCTKDYETEPQTFWLNTIPQKGNGDTGITKFQIHRVNDHASHVGIIQTGGRNILLYATNKTKLGRFYILKIFGAFKIIPEIIFGEFPIKQNDRKIETADHKIDCQGKVEEYTIVPDGNTMKVYILTEINEADYCFMIIDLINFELKKSSLLVPHNLRYGGYLVSNSKCIIRGNGSDHVCVWDHKSGACSNHQNRADYEYILCEIHPTNPELIITAEHDSKKFILRRLNSLICPPFSQTDK